MSRVGKQAITIPSGVKASLSGAAVLVEGPKGKISIPFEQNVKLNIDSELITVDIQEQSRQARANWGTTRSLVANAVQGVANGWEKKLELSGVGFTAALKGKVLTLATGYSHKSDVQIPDGVECKVDKQAVSLSSCNKQLVGQVAASIRSVCPPEPYLGKGIRYHDETVRRKAGKAGAK